MYGLRSRVEFLGTVISLVALTSVARAQQRTRSMLPPLELRVDAINVRSTERGTLQGGVGANLPLGSYVRLEVNGAAGVTKQDSISNPSGRVDALARFLLDPFAESQWGLSIGGGMSAIIQESRTRGYLVVVLDMETPRVGSMVPALQLGLGGGARVGLIVRAYRPGQR